LNSNTVSAAERVAIQEEFAEALQEGATGNLPGVLLRLLPASVSTFQPFRVSISTFSLTFDVIAFSIALFAVHTLRF
jgi:hypothetical protein